MPTPPLRRYSTLRIAGLMVGALLIASACTGTASPSAGGGDPGRITVTVTEWGFALSAATAPAGTVAFSIVNSGANEHEFVLIRTDMKADSLPIKGVHIDVDAMGGAMPPEASMMTMSMDPGMDMDHPMGTVGVIASIASGGSDELKVENLEAGHYVIICDLENHYERGMHVDFTVI